MQNIPVWIFLMVCGILAAITFRIMYRKSKRHEHTPEETTVTGVLHGVLVGVPIGGARITDQTIISLENPPFNALAGYRLLADGTAEQIPYLVIPGEWRLSGASADYEVRAVKFSGEDPTVGSDSLNTWLGLGTDRGWYLDLGPFDFGTSVLDIEIRRTSDSVVVTSARITLETQPL
jgi:hypothetical protein